MIPKTYMKFLYGDFLELLLLFLAKEAGHTVENEQLEVEVDGVKGHLDCTIDGVVVDCKSASPYAFQKFKDDRFLSDDPFGYIYQLSGYSNVVSPTNPRAAFLVADKVHGDIALAEVSAEIALAHSPLPRIQHLKKVLQQEEEPERCYQDKLDGKSGNRVLDTGCSYCAFAQHCWRDANGGRGLETYIYSTGPKYFTHVAREPRVDKVEF